MWRGFAAKIIVNTMTATRWLGFTDFFPLHNTVEREKLKDVWVRFSVRQPLHEVREYFGEYVALYFSYLGKNIGLSSLLTYVQVIIQVG